MKLTRTTRSLLLLQNQSGRVHRAKHEDIKDVRDGDELNYLGPALMPRNAGGAKACFETGLRPSSA
jgi:hypothetical protein